jgi:hypothetical protein
VAHEGFGTRSTKPVDGVHERCHRLGISLSSTGETQDVDKLIWHALRRAGLVHPRAGDDRISPRPAREDRRRPRDARPLAGPGRPHCPGFTTQYQDPSTGHRLEDAGFECHVPQRDGIEVAAVMQLLNDPSPHVGNMLEPLVLDRCIVWVTRTVVAQSSSRGSRAARSRCSTSRAGSPTRGA